MTPIALAHRVSEAVGTAGGWLLAPVTSTLSRLRHARMFHPDGVVARATLQALHDDDALAQRLAGPALVRLSAALWRGGREWPDVLGIALRLRDDDALGTEAGPRDQDLLFATIRHPYTMPFAPLTTDPHDFLGNDYYAVSPFDAPPRGRILLRLMRPVAHAKGDNRVDGLRRAIEAGEATFTLEIAREHPGRYEPLATLRLDALVDVDQRTLRFDPFRTGRDVVPRGFVHALRTGAYAASRWGRGAPTR